MKIRIDFVTNSSSSSFGTAFVGSLISSAGVLSGILAAEAAELNKKMMEGLRGAAGQVAQAAVQATESQARQIEAQIDSALSTAETALDSERQSIQDEIAAYKQQWADAQQGIDPKDPGYGQFKRQYDDYFKYLESKIADIDSKQYEIQVEKAKQQAEAEAKQEWVRQRQEDMIAVLEERAMLQATSAGYGKAGYNVSAMKARLTQLGEREQELRKTLSENNASIDYTPRDRGEIGPGREFDQIRRDREALVRQREEERKRKNLNKAQREAMEARYQKALDEQAQTQASAARWDAATKFAEGVQVGADLGVDVLSNITGPAGKSIKTIYTGAKGVAGGVGNAIADGGDVLSNVGKGVLKGAADIVKDKLGDEKYGKYAKDVFTVGSEAVQGGIDSYTKGEGFMSGAKTGLLKGSVEAAGNQLAKRFLPEPTAAGPDWGKKPLGDVIQGIRQRNPLTAGVLKSNARAALQNAGLDQAKNLAKGDDVIFSGWKHNYLG